MGDNREILKEIIHENKSSALVALNTVVISEGEVLKIRYKTSKGNVDALIAVGVKDGVGPSCYTLVSDQSIPIITSILNSRPDVSDVVYGAIYIYNDPASNSYRKYFIIDNDLVDEELTEDFYFTNLEDGLYYYFDATPGQQKIINVSTNLSDKSSFQGIMNVTKERYQELVDNQEIIDDMVYLVNNGSQVVQLYYNYMPFDFEIDSESAFAKFSERLGKLEDRMAEFEVESVSWLEEET